MTRVHPTLLYNDFLNCMNESWWRTTRLGLIVTSVVFFTRQFSCAAAALCAFAIKILAVGLTLLNSDMSWLWRFSSLLSLMVQCMGCILMEQVLQDRIFLFVFGGQNATYEDDEQAYKNVYECRIAKQIWIDYWQSGNRIKAIVLLATLDHYDLQNLLIEKDKIEVNLHDLNGSMAFESMALETLTESHTHWPERDNSFRGPPTPQNNTEFEAWPDETDPWCPFSKLTRGDLPSSVLPAL